jgi:hypothetical protein
MTRNRYVLLGGLAILAIVTYAVFVTTRSMGMSTAYRRSGAQAFQAITKLQAETAKTSDAYEPRLKEAQNAVAEADRLKRTETDIQVQGVLSTYLEAIEWSRLSRTTLEQTRGGYPHLVKQRQQSHDLDVKTVDICEKEARQIFDRGSQPGDYKGQCEAARRQVVDAIISR